MDKEKKNNLLGAEHLISTKVSNKFEDRTVVKTINVNWSTEKDRSKQKVLYTEQTIMVQ